MIYFPFKNYEEFKELFGIVEHGNGVKSRKNKILLSLFKEKFWLRNHIAVRERQSWIDACIHQCTRVSAMQSRGNAPMEHELRSNYIISYAQNRSDEIKPTVVADLLECTGMAELKKVAMAGIQRGWKDGCLYRLELNGQTFRSDKYETDDWNGLCEDGTVNAIRYYNNERESVFKMKAGKMFNHILACSTFADHLTEAVKRFLSEEFVAEWVQYASENLADEEFTLHVDGDFESIYTWSACAGNFHSCMTDNGQWRFYRDAVKAKAAYLTNADDKIVARCIIFTDVYDENDKVWRLAERQYSTDGDLSLQRKLISALIRGKHIDGYKRVGASCHNANDFVDNNGNSLSDVTFRIDCDLDTDDVLSYQDSFKWYKINDRLAYNHSCCCDYMLDITADRLEENHDDDCWSDYHSEWIPEGDAYYIDTREDYFYYDDVCSAFVYDISRCRFVEENCFRDDCIEINGAMYYAGRNAESPEDYGLCCCDDCGEYFAEGDGVYSELTERDYCCEYCLERAERRYKEDYWYYSEYDDEYYEDGVVEVLEWSAYRNKYVDTTIYRDTLNELIESGDATEYEGKIYLDAVLFDGEPEHIAAESCVA